MQSSISQQYYGVAPNYHFLIDESDQLDLSIYIGRAKVSSILFGVLLFDCLSKLWSILESKRLLGLRICMT